MNVAPRDWLVLEESPERRFALTIVPLRMVSVALPGFVVPAMMVPTAISPTVRWPVDELGGVQYQPPGPKSNVKFPF